MRYQQKVMQENTQKKNDLYGYDDTQQKLLTSSLGAGKVRAMFDERRSRITAGIDKSYLLEPITVDTSKATKQQRQVIGPSKNSRDQKMPNYTKVIVPPLQNRLINHDINGNNHITSSDTLDRSLKSSDTVLVNFKSTAASSKLSTKSNTVTEKNGSNINSTRKPLAMTSAPLKNVTNQKPSPTRSTKSGNSTTSSNSVRSTAYTSPKPTATNSKTPSAKSSQQNSFDEVDDTPVPEGLIRCSICKRNFAEDRIEKHQVICQKMKTKKRKIYDSSKKRVQGTEAETYNKKPISRVAVKSATTPSSKSSNWRAKHEDFVKTIRAAKEMQAYVAKGGKLSDLPPPPPSINPDYVQCPNCSRRFNEAAASRHIPICQTLNKPKPKTGGSLASKTTSSIKRR
ncbi:zinc finger C2HC domain-containing protein 1C isoform X2 [Chironomus tepperi]